MDETEIPSKVQIVAGVGGTAVLNEGGLLSSSVHFAFEIAGCTHVDSPE